MEIMIWQNGLSFQGKVKDLVAYLNSLPKDVKLADYLASQLH